MLAFKHELAFVYEFNGCISAVTADILSILSMHGQDEVRSSQTTELDRDFRRLQSDMTSIRASSLYLLLKENQNINKSNLSNEIICKTVVSTARLPVIAIVFKLRISGKA